MRKSVFRTLQKHRADIFYPNFYVKSELWQTHNVDGWMLSYICCMVAVRSSQERTFLTKPTLWNFIYLSLLILHVHHLPIDSSTKDMAFYNLCFTDSLVC